MLVVEGKPRVRVTIDGCGPPLWGLEKAPCLPRTQNQWLLVPFEKAADDSFVMENAPSTAMNVLGKQE